MSESELVERLRAIVEYKAAWKRDPNGQFERLAKQFYRETGLMAPGKSLPVEMRQDDAERQQRWNEFTARLSAERDATILQAADALDALLSEIRETPRAALSASGQEGAAPSHRAEWKLCRDCPTPSACATWPNPKCLSPSSDERQMREAVAEYLGILREGHITATQPVRNRIVTLACILFGKTPDAQPLSASGQEGAAQEPTKTQENLRLLASAMRKMLPAPLLAEVVAHLDPLTPFVRFLREERE